MDLTLHSWSTTTNRQRQSPVMKKTKQKTITTQDFQLVLLTETKSQLLPLADGNTGAKVLSCIDFYWLSRHDGTDRCWKCATAPQRETDTLCRRRLPRCYGAAGRSRQLKAIFNVVTICGKKKTRPCSSSYCATITGKRINQGKKSDG